MVLTLYFLSSQAEIMTKQTAEDVITVLADVQRIVHANVRVQTLAARGCHVFFYY